MAGGKREELLDIGELGPMMEVVRSARTRRKPCTHSALRFPRRFPRRRQQLPLFHHFTGLRRAYPKGGHLSSVATMPPVYPSAASRNRPDAKPRPPIPDALQRACLVAKTAADNKAENVVVLDLSGVTTEFDYFVIATGASRRQVHTIVEEADAALRAVGDERLNVEGYESSKWVVQDYGDVLVHVFDPATRDYYKIEELWADAEKIDWEKELE